MSKLIVISLSLLFLLGDSYANEKMISEEDGEDIIIFGDDENDSTENDDISDAEDENEDEDFNKN